MAWMANLTRRGFLAAGALGAACGWRQGDASLVQEAVGLAPSYWSTWGAQRYSLDPAQLDLVLKGEGLNSAAGQLTEDRLFGDKGWASALDRRAHV